jgi:hypothetical protein
VFAPPPVSGCDEFETECGNDGGYCDPSQGPCDNTCVGADGFTQNPNPNCQIGGVATGGGGTVLDVDAETGGTGIANRVLKWLPKALKKLAKFKVKSGSGCDTDLSDIGLSQGTIQTIASTVSVLNAATSNPAVYMSLEAQGGDFGVITGTAGPIYYDQNNFWQPSLTMLMATLIHEFSHVNGFGDAQDQLNLGLTVGAPTVNITKKIATDCFGYKGPIE